MDEEVRMVFKGVFEISYKEITDVKIQTSYQWDFNIVGFKDYKGRKKIIAGPFLIPRRITAHFRSNFSCLG